MFLKTASNFLETKLFEYVTNILIFNERNVFIHAYIMTFVSNRKFVFNRFKFSGNKNFFFGNRNRFCFQKICFCYQKQDFLLQLFYKSYMYILFYIENENLQILLEKLKFDLKNCL